MFLEKHRKDSKNAFFCRMFAVTTVDTGSKALEFLGLRESNDPNALETHQVLFFFIIHLVFVQNLQSSSCFFECFVGFLV